MACQYKESKVKPSVYWAIIPFFLGTAVFGIFKSLELAKKNKALETSVQESRIQLAKLDIAFKESQLRVNSVNGRNEMLLDDLAALKKTLAVKEEQIESQTKNIILLSQKFQETATAYAALVQENLKHAEDVMALAFKNNGLKKEISPAQKLKRGKNKVNPKKKNGKKESFSKATPPPVSMQGSVGPSSLAEAISMAVGGNEGFVVKDGETTYDRQVEITVEPQANEPVR